MIEWIILNPEKTMAITVVVVLAGTLGWAFMVKQLLEVK